jgi:MoxR-like ATPase
MLSAVVARTRPSPTSPASPAPPARDLRAWAEAELGNAVLRYCRRLVADPKAAVTLAERQALRKQRDKVLRLLRREIPTKGL